MVRMCAGSAIWWVLTRLSQVRFINRCAPFVVCRLPLNPSVYSAALRGGCCVSRPVWWMLVVLDCAVCLQSNKRRLLLLLLLLLHATDWRWWVGCRWSWKLQRLLVRRCHSIVDPSVSSSSRTHTVCKLGSRRLLIWTCWGKCCREVHRCSTRARSKWDHT